MREIENRDLRETKNQNQKETKDKIHIQYVHHEICTLQRQDLPDPCKNKSNKIEKTNFIFIYFHIYVRNKCK